MEALDAVEAAMAAMTATAEQQAAVRDHQASTASQQVAATRPLAHSLPV
jgi:hypothetical protein